MLLGTPSAGSKYRLVKEMCHSPYFATNSWPCWPMLPLTFPPAQQSLKLIKELSQQEEMAGQW